MVPDSWVVQRVMAGLAVSAWFLALWLLFVVIVCWFLTRFHVDLFTYVVIFKQGLTAPGTIETAY